jgi:agmatine deiminase
MLPHADESETAGGPVTPAEWEPHRATWMAWPHDAVLWGDGIDRVVDEFVALCRAIAGGGGEHIELLVHETSNERYVRERLVGLDVTFHHARYGDIWLRDTAPVFVRTAARLGAVAFYFNGWGGKFEFDGDREVATAVAGLAGVEMQQLDWIGEGGALEMNGDGMCLASRSCLLSSARNPSLTERDLEQSLQAAFGVNRVVWLDANLAGDHTDGHIDTLARFVAPDTVVCAEANPADEPNAIALQQTRQALVSTDGLSVVTLPSPGRLIGEEGMPLPASYLNFYIANDVVVVPTYGSPNDEEAVDVLAGHFEGRRVIGSSACAILEGGGAFHCITQQEPRV